MVFVDCDDVDDNDYHRNVSLADGSSNSPVGDCDDGGEGSLVPGMRMHRDTSLDTALVSVSDTVHMWR